jgi:hypothetical protein
MNKGKIGDVTHRKWLQKTAKAGPKTGQAGQH